MCRTGDRPHGSQSPQSRRRPCCSRCNASHGSPRAASSSGLSHSEDATPTSSSRQQSAAGSRSGWRHHNAPEILSCSKRGCFKWAKSGRAASQMGVSREGRCHGSEAAPRKPSQSIASGAVPFLGITGAANSLPPAAALGLCDALWRRSALFPQPRAPRPGALNRP